MAKQQAEKIRPAVVDEALRQKVAQWVKEALGELLEEDETVAASSPVSCSKGAERARTKHAAAHGRTRHTKEG